MFYKIKGSNNLAINKLGNLKAFSLAEEQKIGIPLSERFRYVDDDKVKLKLYDIEYTVERKWLYLYACIGLYMPDGFGQYVTRYRFREKYQGFDRKKKNMTKGENLSLVIIFSKPIYIATGLRLIAEYPDYAITEDKRLYNITEQRFISFGEYNNNSYIYARMKSTFSGEVVNRPLHVLAALTWIENEDYVKFPIVNHKDGDKRNWRVDNLEWTNHSGNINHAYENGLRSDNRNIKMYDSLKKKTYIFHSVTDAFRFIDAFPRANLNELFEERNGFYIAKDRYEFRYLDDKRDFALKKMTVKEARELDKSKIKTRTVYEAIRLKDKHSVIGTNTIMQKEIGLSESGVTGICRKKTIFEDKDGNDWIIREQTDEPLDLSVYKKVGNKRIPIRGINIKENRAYVFGSLRDAGRETKFDPITIRRMIDGNRTFDNWKFQYITKEEYIARNKYNKALKEREANKELNKIEKALNPKAEVVFKEDLESLLKEIELLFPLDV